MKLPRFSSTARSTRESANFDNTAGDFVDIGTNADPNNPGLGCVGRWRIQNEKRLVTTEGAHLDWTQSTTRQTLSWVWRTTTTTAASGSNNSREWQQVGVRRWRHLHPGT